MNSRPTKTLQKKIENILNKKFKTVSFFDSTTRHTPSSLKNFLLDKFKNYNNKDHYKSAVVIYAGEVQFYLPYGMVSVDFYNMHKAIKETGLTDLTFVIVSTWGQSYDLQVKNFLAKKDKENKYISLYMPVPNQEDFENIDWQSHEPKYKFSYCGHNNILHRQLFSKFLIKNNLHKENIVAFTNRQKTYDTPLRKYDNTIEEDEAFVYAPRNRQDNWINDNEVMKIWDDTALENIDHPEIPPYDLKTYQPYQQKAYINIIGETVFDYPYPRFTEKVFGPILSKRIFILLAPADTLKELRDIGFQTFDDIFSEEYDTVSDPNKRFRIICDLILKLNELPIDKFEKLHIKADAIHKHNLLHFKKLSNNIPQDILQLNNI
jgi:hypothetical protein